jgi:hypothetical protein
MVVNSTTGSQLSASDSSPLSEPYSVQDLEHDESAIHDRDQEKEQTATADETSFGFVRPMPVEGDSHGDETFPLFGCPHCDKTYTTGKSLRVSWILRYNPDHWLTQT